MPVVVPAGTKVFVTSVNRLKTSVWNSFHTLRRRPPNTIVRLQTSERTLTPAWQQLVLTIIRD